MAGCIVKVYWEPHCRISERAPWNMVETDFPDFEQFLIAVDENRLICGSQLWFRPGEERGEHVIKSRVPTAFRGRAIDRVELPHGRFVEELDEVAP